MQCCRSAGERSRVASADGQRQLTLESVYMRSEWRNPIRIESVKQQLSLGGTHVRWGKVDSSHAQPLIVLAVCDGSGVRETAEGPGELLLCRDSCGLAAGVPVNSGLLT